MLHIAIINTLKMPFHSLLLFNTLMVEFFDLYPFEPNFIFFNFDPIFFIPEAAELFILEAALFIPEAALFIPEAATFFILEAASVTFFRLVFP